MIDKILKDIRLELDKQKDSRDLYGIATAIRIVENKYLEVTGKPMIDWKCCRCGKDAGYKQGLSCYCEEHCVAEFRDSWTWCRSAG